MGDWLVAHEAALRLGVFAALFGLFAVLEARFPARQDGLARRALWPTNLVLMALSAGLARALGLIAPLAAAVWAERSGFGLFNLWRAPPWLAFAVTLVALDFALYAQHRFMHAAPFLWRLHAPHHAAPTLDVSTGVRFHPFEAAFSLAWTSSIVALLGAPAAAVIVFAILLNGFSLFTHANLALSPRLEQILSPWLITPALHRRHHDRDHAQDAVNFGFALALWDRLFATFSSGPEPARLGLPEQTPQQGADLVETLALPLTWKRPPPA